jgi:hypothetical protein
MMKLGLLLFAAVTIQLAVPDRSPAQQFPRLQEENLNGQQVVLPDAASGKVSVLVMGFSKASKTPTEAWAKRIESDFGKNSEFALYQLPVLEAVPKIIRGMVISGIKKGVAENQRANFVPALHNEDELKKLVGFKAEDDAYIVVLDPTGKITYQTHGLSVDPGYAELKAKLQALLK